MDKKDLFLKVMFEIEKMYTSTTIDNPNLAYALYINGGQTVCITGFKDGFSGKIYYEENSENRQKLIIEAKIESKVRKKRFDEFKKIENENRKINYNFLDKESGTVKAFVSEKISELEEIAKQIYQSLRWRYNLADADNSCFNKRLIFWSFDNENWHEIVNNRIIITQIEPLKIGIEETNETLKNTEPIYHDLFREAVGLQKSNHRSSLLIAVTALETCIKKAISSKVDYSEWLINNIPSPPVHKILEDYLPIILEDFKLSNEELKEINNSITERNKLVHTGSEPKKESLAKRLKLIKEILYRIDFYLGNEWAIEYFKAR